MRSGRVLVIFASIQCFIVTPSSAQAVDSFTLANKLGSVLAAEEFCGLSYDQAAIKRFISENVPADDMGFASMLRTMTNGQESQQKNMRQSQKTAHCTQIERVAKSHGFAP